MKNRGEKKKRKLELGENVPLNKNRDIRTFII